MRIVMPTTFIRTVRVIAQPTINGRFLRRDPHNGDLLAPCLHVKVAATKQRRNDGAAAEADLPQDRVFLDVIICIRRITRAKVDAGDAAVGLPPAQLDDMDGGVVEGKDGIEVSPIKGCRKTVTVNIEVLK